MTFKFKDKVIDTGKYTPSINKLKDLCIRFAWLASETIRDNDVNLFYESREVYFNSRNERDKEYNKVSFEYYKELEQRGIK